MWVRDEATFVPDLDGEGFWQGFMLDITERKRAEDQLREAELKFRTIVEQNQAIFYTQDIDPDDPAVSRTTYIAPGNTEMLGYTSRTSRTTRRCGGRSSTPTTGSGCSAPTRRATWWRATPPSRWNTG